MGFGTYQDEEKMSWDDVAEVLSKMVDQPPDSDLYMTPAAKAHADKFVAEMRALHFPVPRVQADDGQNVAFQWSNKLRLVVTATVAEFIIIEEEKR
jgi:hypothetical protein